MDHEAVEELHALGTLTAQLAAHDELAALHAALHDEAQHAVAGTAEGIENAPINKLREHYDIV